MEEPLPEDPLTGNVKTDPAPVDGKPAHKEEEPLQLKREPPNVKAAPGDGWMIEQKEQESTSLPMEGGQAKSGILYSLVLFGSFVVILHVVTMLFSMFRLVGRFSFYTVFCEKFTRDDVGLVLQSYVDRMTISRMEVVHDLQKKEQRIRQYLPSVRAALARKEERQRQKEIAAKGKKRKRKGTTKKTPKRTKKELGTEANMEMMKLLDEKDQEEAKLDKQQKKSEKKKKTRQRRKRKTKTDQEVAQPDVRVDSDENPEDIDVIVSDIDQPDEELIPYEIVDQGRTKPSEGGVMMYRICWLGPDGPIRVPDKEMTWQDARFFDADPDFSDLVKDWKFRRPKRFNAKCWNPTYE